MDTLLLDGSWTLEALDRMTIQHYCPSLCEGSLETSIPFDVHSVLLDEGLIDNPYRGQRALSSSFITEIGWKLKKTFTFHKKPNNISTLVLSRVDTFTTVFVNGRKAGETSSAFARYLFDITNDLVEGENTIEIEFAPLNKKLEERRKENPSIQDFALARKPHKHFSPYAITPIGIYDPIKIVSDEYLFVKSWNCIPRLVDHNWIMKVEVTARVFKEADVDFNISVASAKEHTVTHITPREDYYSFTFTIPEEDVSLWYPAGMGGQHLYPMDVSFGSHSDRRMIAFRTIRLDNSADEKGRAFRILVNEEEVFIKGAIWTSLDILPSRISSSKCIRMLQSAAQVGLNAIRVHCSSAYESEVFYDSCDRLGLLVWQDLMFDEAIYPKTEDFKKEVGKELRYQILRLKSHPCIMLFCGGNSPASLIGDDMQAIIDYDRLNNGLLERLVRQLNPSAIYVPHSSAETLDSTIREHESHSYGLSYSKDNSSPLSLKEQNRATPRFSSAISYPSIPSLSSVTEYCEERELNIATDSMMRHQSDLGGLDLVISSILLRYRFPSSLEKMIYLSQLVHSGVISSVVDHYRSQGDTCKGIFVKYLTSPYPATDESAIEYSGKWKMLMYQFRHIFSPLTTICLTEDGNIKVLAVNDTGKEEEVKISLKFSSFNGDKLKMQVFRKVLPPHSVTPITTTPYGFVKNPREAFAYVKLSTPDIYVEDLIFLEEPKRCHLVDPKLNVKVKKNGKFFLCEVSCMHPAFNVVLDAGKAKGVFSDNLFSIRPTAQKIVTFFTEDDIALEDFEKELKIYDLWWAST